MSRTVDEAMAVWAAAVDEAEAAADRGMYRLDVEGAAVYAAQERYEAAKARWETTERLWAFGAVWPPVDAVAGYEDALGVQDYGWLMETPGIVSPLAVAHIFSEDAYGRPICEIHGKNIENCYV